MKTNLTSSFALITTSTAELQFNCDTAVCLGSIDEQNFLTFVAGSKYTINTNLNVYAKALVIGSNSYVNVLEFTNTGVTVSGSTDIASAALTTSATSSAVSNSLGNGFQINVTVTTVTGTNPTLDIRIEESFDGGTNWVTLYEMQRVTATGSYNSPVIRATGRHIRYVRTVGGTSPSFTNRVIRNVLPFIPTQPQKRLMDRSISLTTLNSVTPVLFSGESNNVQLVISLGTATTPPTIQLEGSEDGIKFYDIGTPLTGVASSTAQTTVNGLSATYVRARVSTIGATVVAGYVSIKAWS